MSNEKLNVMGMEFKPKDEKIAEALQFNSRQDTVMMSESIKDIMPENLITDEFTKLQEKSWSVISSITFNNDESLQMVGILIDMNESISENVITRTITFKVDAIDAMLATTRFMLTNEETRKELGIKEISCLELSNICVEESLQFDLSGFELVKCQTKLDYKTELARFTMQLSKTMNRIINS